MNEAGPNVGPDDHKRRVDVGHEECRCGDPVCAALTVAFLAKWSLKTFAGCSAARVYTLATEFRPDHLPSFDEHVGYFNELICLVAAVHRMTGACRLAETELGPIISSCENCAKVIRDELCVQKFRSTDDREKWIKGIRCDVLKRFWVESADLDGKASAYFDHYYNDNSSGHQEGPLAMPIHEAGVRLCCAAEMQRGTTSEMPKGHGGSRGAEAQQRDNRAR